MARRSTRLLLPIPLLTACPSVADRPPASAQAATARPEAVDTKPAREPGTHLRFTAQDGWIEDSPQGAMRKAQYRLPGSDSHSVDAHLVVYFFSGSGGSLEANLERWASQFEQTDGSRSFDRMRRSQRSVAGMSVHEVDLEGTYVAETFPGSGERENKPGWRMLASVIESDHGPYYAKLVGPRDTVARWEASYRRFISDVR
jgi:hypothetical protein